MTGTDVALDALRKDAAAWDTAGNTASGPAGAVGALGLTGADVSFWAANAGLDRTYDTLRTAVRNQLSQAAANFHTMASTLRDTADTYEREELKTAESFRGFRR
ncbi:hypothetical protein ACOBQX_28790 [Actinokineospora sp. G85]|uniref:hypothetical protein n=1 Tax=Actinokineospora sp. G85 TaxID=3406626 RepID=UPI003C76E552